MMHSLKNNSISKHINYSVARSTTLRFYFNCLATLLLHHFKWLPVILSQSDYITDGIGLFIWVSLSMSFHFIFGSSAICV